MREVSHYVRFFIAVVFCAALIGGDLHYAAFDNLRGGMSLVLVPFRAVAKFPRDAYDVVDGYLRSRKALLAERSQLEQQIEQEAVKIKSLDFYIRQNDELRRLLNLKQQLPGEWLAAEVLRNVSQPATRRFFLDKGLEDGVVLGQAVVDETGVIGQVIRADINVCAVGLLSNSGQWISTRVRRNNLLVILRGDGDDMVLEYVTNDADIQVGDELVADGGVFPPGYPVAVVEMLAPGVVYQRGQARLHSDFSDSSFVLLYFANTQFDSAAVGLR